MPEIFQLVLKYYNHFLLFGGDKYYKMGLRVAVSHRFHKSYYDKKWKLHRADFPNSRNTE